MKKYYVHNMTKLKIISKQESKIKKNQDFNFFLKWLNDDIDKVNTLILSNMASKVPLISQLAGYIISSGGKRIRPILTLATSKLCKYSGERHINLAAAIEFIHTATLLHDDVVDESNKRRGQKSANIVWDNKSSILVGDFLLSKAFRLMIKDGSHRCLDTLSKASIEISQGEVLQLLTNNNIQTSETKYLEVINAKTAELFGAACIVSGIISEVGREKEIALYEFGKNLGISFQIIDDTLDYFSNDQSFGKNKGDDFKEGKVSIPIILAYMRSNSDEKKFWTRVINDKNQKKEDLDIALSIIKKYEVLSDCFKKAKHFSLIAKDSLGAFENSIEKEKLINIADFAINRIF